MSDQDTLSSDVESPYLTFTQIGAHWHARGSLKKLFVFGDSYSSRLSGAWGTDEDDLHDIDDDDDATWVDFLVSSLSSSSTSVVLNNFAFPGATVKYDLDGQLIRFFDEFSATKPEEATFVFFLGINDCGMIPGEGLSSLVEVLFDTIHQLYTDVTARNFILVDVPPTDRSPAAAGTTTDFASRIEKWNKSLVTYASDYTSNNTQVTVQVFSSNKVLSEVLDDPGAQGFAENAKDVVGRGIWRDSLHLTPAVAGKLSLWLCDHEYTIHVMNASFHLLMVSIEIAPVADAGPLPAGTPSLMPFHISYTGPAPISRYFRPRPAPPSIGPLSVRPSSTATLVASSSSTSVLSETKSGLTAMSSTTSLGNLAHESEWGEDELLSKTKSSVEVVSQVEQATTARIPVDTVMEMDSETQPALGAVLHDNSSGPTSIHTPGSSDVKRFLAAFRGRQMYGQEVDIPTGYGGLVLRAPMDSEGKDKEDMKASSKPLSQRAKPKSKTRAATRQSKRAAVDDLVDEPKGRDEGDCCSFSNVDPPLTRNLIPSSTFASFMLWTPDRPLDEGRDEYARALVEWTHLASEIHSYDE